MSRNAPELLIWSAVIAIGSASTRWTVQVVTGASFDFVVVSGLLSIPWVVILAISLRRYGRRGLWVLVGAPLVFFWPAAFVMLWYACEHGAACF